MHTAPHCSLGQGQGGVRSDLIGDIRQFLNHILFLCLYFRYVLIVLLTIDPSSMESKLITVTWN